MYNSPMSQLSLRFLGLPGISPDVSGLMLATYNGPMSQQFDRFLGLPGIPQDVPALVSVMCNGSVSHRLVPGITWDIPGCPGQACTIVPCLWCPIGSWEYLGYPRMCLERCQQCTIVPCLSCTIGYGITWDIPGYPWIDAPHVSAVP